MTFVEVRRITFSIRLTSTQAMPIQAIAHLDTAPFSFLGLFGVRDYAFNYVAPANEWVHLAISAGASGTCLFTNGVLHSCLSTTISLPLDFFGSTPASFNDILRAEIDELRVWQRERSGGEILATMRYRLGGSESGLVGYWKGDENVPTSTPNSARDSSLPAAQFNVVTRQPSTVPFAPEDGNTPPQFGILPTLNTQQDRAVQTVLEVLDAEQSQLILTASSGNPAVIPDTPDHLSLLGSGRSRTLRLAPAAGMSGLVPIHLTLSDGLATTKAQVLLRVIASQSASSVQLTAIDTLPGSRVRLQFRTGLNSNAIYAVEQAERIGEPAEWTEAPPSIPIPLGGQQLAVELPMTRPIGFFRVRGMQPVRASFGAARFEVNEGAGKFHPVVLFDGPYQGLLRYSWSYERPDGSVTNYSAALEVDGNTAAIPLVIDDNDSWDTVRSIRLTIEPGTGFQPGSRMSTRLDLVDNDTQWSGRLQSRLFSDKLWVDLVDSGATIQAILRGDGHSLLPVGSWKVAAISNPSLFAARFGPITIPADQSYLREAFSVWLSLRADTAHAGHFVNPDSLQGEAEWVFEYPNRAHLNSTNNGTFSLLRTPPSPPANPVQLVPLR
jgi:hypothetical protein